MSEGARRAYASRRFPIFVINLDRHSERMANMAKQLESLRLDFIRFSGVDGKELAEESQTAVARCAELTNGEIGCFESHRRIWHIVTKMDAEGAFVIEDDMALASDFATWELPSDVLESAHLIKVDTAINKQTEYGSSAVRLGQGRSLVRLLGNEYSTGCYFVTKRGALELLWASEQYILPVDRFMFNRVSKLFWRMKVWKMDPAAAIQYRFLPQSCAGKNGLGDSISSDRSTLQMQPPPRFGIERWRTVLKKLARGEFEAASRIRTNFALREFRGKGEISRRSIPFVDIPNHPPRPD